MQGPPVDRLGRPILTLQMHAADPVRYPYVSLSGDLQLFAYGQRVVIPALGRPSAAWQRRTGNEWYVGRIVDTGCRFFTDPTATRCGPQGARKVLRFEGHEPIDVPVDTKAQAFQHVRAQMAMVPGDVLDPRTGRPVRPRVA